MQFYAGIFISDQTNNKKKCYLSKVNTEGVLERSKVLDTTSTQSSECYALSLISHLNQIVAVGKISNGVTTAALILHTDQDLGLYTKKMWSSTFTVDGSTYPYQEARDVAVTSDGGIFVTGIITNAFTKGSSDCFILRLDDQLDLVYAKSFGASSEYLECYSIQVTRNYDYIYLGGTKKTSSASYNQLLFLKMDTYADTIIATSLSPTSGTETLSMRRIILENKKTFSGTHDNAKLYFCGYTNTRNGEMIFGYLTSNSLVSADFDVQVAFRYGSPDSEEIGDCALTSDNGYFIGLMNTKHSVDRGTNYGTGVPINTQYTYPTTVTANINLPYSCSCGSCSQIDVFYHISSTDQTNIINYCESNLYSQLTSYTIDYSSEIYSWRTCDYYKFDFNDVDCSLSDIKFPYCSATSGTSGSYYSYTYCCYYCCYCSNTVNCEWPMTSSNDGINTWKPWYGTSTASPGCRNDQFKKNVWEDIFNAYYGGNEYKLLPYMFCGKSTTFDTLASNNYCNYDYYQFLYEQDCTDDSNTYWNWFIFRVDVDMFTSANVDNIPEMAAYFGDPDGYLYGYAVGVDDFGYIYISGTSNSDAFGADSPEIMWVYAKTHWDMTFEVRKTFSVGAAFTPHSTYLGKRFIQPKKFKNNQNPYDPSSAASTYEFMYVFYPSLSTQNQYTSFKAYPINENIESWTSPVFTWTTYDLDDRTWGDNFARMNLALPITVYNSSSTHTYSFSISNLCQYTASSPTIDSYKQYYVGKLYIYDTTSISSLAIVNTTSDFSGQLQLTGDPTGTSEGIYYLWTRGTTTAYTQNIGSSSTYSCSYSQYYAFYDFDYYESLRRFQTSQRIRIIVDDEYKFPPSIKQNIPDIQPILGFRYLYEDIDSYFKVPRSGNSECDYYKVMQSRDDTTSPPSTQLPYWMNFHESNFSFSMYPQSLGEIYVEVHCCNNIDQCAINTFKIDPIDTTPKTDKTWTTQKYVIQYDAYETVGQYFTWAQTIEWFYDEDEAQSTDSTLLTTYDPTDTSYHHVDHTVWLTIISPYVNGFDSVVYIGMLFGQAYKITASNNIGTKTISFEYQDPFGENSVPSSTFDILINRQPSPTTTGINYAFSDIDPLDVVPTTYFDQFFPFVKDDYSTSIDVDTSLWFTDPDNDQLTYECTYSDGTTRPDWMGYDTSSGELIGYPTISDSSEYMNLRFTAYDTNDGYYTYIKTLLVDAQPRAQTLYKVIRVSANKDFSYFYGDLITDVDGDQLTFYLVQTSDINTLQGYDIEIQPPKNVIAGHPKKIGVIGSVQLRAEDVHGLYATVYITIIVNQYSVIHRKKVIQYPDVTVVEYQRFSFMLSNEVFYDPDDSSALVLFASTEYDRPLPQWVHFYPNSRTFYGVAAGPQTFMIQVRAMNEISHDSLTTEFRLTVISNENPKTICNNINEDIVIYTNTWFEETLSIQVFRDYEFNYQKSIAMSGSSGVVLPDWIKFNFENRTIYGVPDTTGVFRLDFTFTDDGGKKTYSNLKVTVLPKYQIKLTLLILSYAITISSFMGMMVFLTYLIHMNIKLFQSHENQESRWKGMKNARRRFKNFNDVEIYFNQRDKWFPLEPSNARTVDYYEQSAHQNNEQNISNTGISQRSAIMNTTFNQDTEAIINDDFFIKKNLTRDI